MPEIPPPLSTQADQMKSVHIDLQDNRKNITDAISNSTEKKTDTFTFQDINSNSPELTDELIEKFADTFRLTFSNPPYNQYLVYPSECRPISAHEVFGEDHSSYICLEKLDGFDIDKYPPHPETGEKATWWHDPKILSKKFHEKLRKSSYMTLQRDSGNGDILGASLGRTCTIQEAFEKEEWENPLYYSQIQEGKHFRSFDNFFRRIEIAIKGHFGYEGKITPDTIIFCFNCVFTTPQLRQSGFIMPLMRNFFNSLPDETKKLFSISEMIMGTKVFSRSVACGMKPVSGILKSELGLLKGDPVIMVSRLNEIIRNFNLPNEEFLELCRSKKS